MLSEFNKICHMAGVMSKKRPLFFNNLKPSKSCL